MSPSCPCKASLYAVKALLFLTCATRYLINLLRISWLVSVGWFQDQLARISLVCEKDKGVTGPTCGRLLSMCACFFWNRSSSTVKSLTLWLLDFSTHFAKLWGGIKQVFRQ